MSDKIEVIRNRSKAILNLIGTPLEEVEKILNPIISLYAPSLLREHMANSVHDTKVLLDALDVSEKHVNKLMNELASLKKELAKTKSMKAYTTKDIETDTFIVIVTWSTGIVVEYEVDSMQVNTFTNMLILTIETSLIHIPLGNVRHYVVEA